jgi:hypothetical protein
VAEEFYAWEAAHPGASSFSYVRDDPYPYTYPTLATLLEDAAYEKHVDLGQAVSCFQLSKDDKPIYMMWSDLEELTVDFSTQLSGQVEVTAATGETGVEDASNLTLTQDPMLVEAP